MFEFAPFGVAAVVGALISRSRIKAWPLLMALAAVAVGFVATLASGEYVAGWMTLPNDVALAILGIVLGGVAGRVYAHISVRQLGATYDGTHTTTGR
jgi:hypothetical protein